MNTKQHNSSGILPRAHIEKLSELCVKKDYEQALAITESLLQEYSQSATLWQIKGISQTALGDCENAISAFTNALRIEPGYVEAHCNIGIAYRRLGNLEKAEEHYESAISLDPTNYHACLNLANVYKDQNKLVAAAKFYSKATNFKPTSVNAWVNLGLVQYQLARLKEAESSYRRALELNPLLPHTNNNLGIILSEQGLIEEAVSYYRAAIEIDPILTEAYRHLANLKSSTISAEQLSKMHELYDTAALTDSQKVHLAFALGKVYEEESDYEESFRFYSSGNSLRRKSLNYSVLESARTFARLKQTFSAEFMRAHSESGFTDSSPIFIVGMPRSGTTLVEQILASHSAVYGAGELTLLGGALADKFESIAADGFEDSVVGSDKEVFQVAGKNYINAVKRRFPVENSFTDKLPLNFIYIGMIKLILPKAKIVHVYRNPMDSCWSIFKNYFDSSGNQYAYDLEELGEYYALYRDLMKHWRNVLPDFVYELEYEKLVKNQEHETRKLLSFCELAWEESCLGFYQNTREVQTASSSQVRKPIYSDSINQWKNYEKWLEPLADAMKLAQK